jgi:septal ring factor EnvC (AmiA/AmiB activator)
MVKKKLLLQSVIFSVALLAGAAQANDFEKELQKNRSALEKLQGEISSLRNQLSNAQKEESSTMSQIEQIEQRLSILSRTRGLLKNESNLLEQKIGLVSRQLQFTEERYASLRQLYAQRVLYMYKYGRLRNLELILSAGSFNQAIIRYRYLKLIAEQDEHTILSLNKRKHEIGELKSELNRDLSSKQANIKAKEHEESVYQANRSEKSGLLKKLRQNQSGYQKQLALKEQEREKLSSIILELERKRQESARVRVDRKKEQPDYVHTDYDDFRKAKGRLPWPVKGKLISAYGKQYDPFSKTYTKNTDITIQSSYGTPVKCVFKGVVRLITYLPGYGNTIIVDHGDGYYTVYSHVDEIFVQKDDIVAAGKVIAAVGDSGSLTGAKLQFGIYGGQRTYDPTEWLQ